MTVMLTCTGPQRVEATSPVQVFVPDDEPDEPDVPEDGVGGPEAEDVVDGAAGAVEEDPAAVAVELVEVW
ncbi:hypothetical protein [Microlunatus flavus]|uniref:hypothetical protein n=1 Tax=Microlunatus flavus TaxID=1036181 RepID=UPI001E451F99|nr:hypothetical protein [Microlunatus flavus]